METIFLDWYWKFRLALMVITLYFRSVILPGRRGMQLATTTFIIMDSPSIYVSELTHEEHLAAERALATLIQHRGELK